MHTGHLNHVGGLGMGVGVEVICGVFPHAPLNKEEKFSWRMERKEARERQTRLH